MKYTSDKAQRWIESLHGFVKRTALRICLLAIMLSGISFPALSQAPGISDVLSSIDTFRNRVNAEKLYVQFDKPYYSTGDTIWLKAYLFDASLLIGSQKSGIVYLELANDTNKVILRRMLPLNGGLGRGNIALVKGDIPEGSYTLRAYTNLMRNFGEDYIFKRNFYISNSSGQGWLVNSDVKISKDAGKENLRLGLAFQNIDKKAVGRRELLVRVVEGNKVLLRDKVETDIEGKLDVNFYLPENADARNISITAEDLSKGENLLNASTRKIVVPVTVSRPENTDLQFMPEGGNLVAGIATRIGFKAIGEDGKGTDVSGKVYSDAGTDEVLAFKSAHKGMGSFELLPKAGETYTARVILPGGVSKTYPLPPVRNTGTVLNIKNLPESDSLEVSVSISPGAASPLFYYLLGQYGSIVCYAAVVRSSVKIKVAKNLFASGIAHFTLLSPDRQPLNERMVYIDQKDELDIRLSSDKSSYRRRDSIALSIQVNDKEGKPVRGSFSLAVTNDAQVNIDSLNNTILSTLLLTSGLKGNIEEPGYYVNKANRQTWDDLDNLLLTQGWVGYDWGKIFSPQGTAEYPAEEEFEVKGRVSNILNKPVAGTRIMMVSLRPLFFMDTLTDSKGEFRFNRFPPIDTAVFKLQATNRKGKQFNVGIEVEEFKPPVFRNESLRFLPWYLNTDTSLLNYVSNTVTRRQEELKFSGKSTLLNEVLITAKKSVKGSKNLNGEGNADIILDDTDMKKAGKINLLQLIQQRVPGFYERVGRTSHGRYFTLNGDPVKLVIDGMDLDFFYTSGAGGRGMMDNTGKSTDPNDHYWFMRDYLEYFSAEDLRGIELMKYGKYSFKYTAEFESGVIPPPQYAWIEITTYSGKGPFMKNTPGTYLYRAMPFVGTRQFYSPKYSPKNSNIALADLRSTIYWNSDIITDTDGKASVSFYSADQPGTYTILMEGSDMTGYLGSKREKIIIKP